MQKFGNFLFLHEIVLKNDKFIAVVLDAKNSYEIVILLLEKIHISKSFSNEIFKP